MTWHHQWDIFSTTITYHIYQLNVESPLQLIEVGNSGGSCKFAALSIDSRNRYLTTKVWYFVLCCQHKHLRVFIPFIIVFLATLFLFYEIGFFKLNVYVSLEYNTKKFPFKCCWVKMSKLLNRRAKEMVLSSIKYFEEGLENVRLRLLFICGKSDDNKDTWYHTHSLT